MGMSFWDLLQAYRDDSGASVAWVMRRAGLNSGTFSAWRARGIPALPKREHLEALAGVLRVEYATLLEAVLRDIGYAPEDDLDQELEDQPADEAPDPIYGEVPEELAARKKEKR